jgi:hypothetical protein
MRPPRNATSALHEMTGPGVDNRIVLERVCTMLVINSKTLFFVIAISPTLAAQVVIELIQ